MKPLHEDQIHNAPFIEACTHIWSDDVSRSQKSGVWDYYQAISKEFNKPLIDHTNIPQKAVIFVGMCHILESIFQVIPTSGEYIFIHRTNDRPYTEQMNDCKPLSVKHVYSCDCRVYAQDVSAIMWGNASVGGEDNIVKQVANEEITPAETKLFVCYNVNRDTPQRTESLPILIGKPFAKVIDTREKIFPIGADDFYRQVKAHKFTMCLAGCSADASRQWAAIQLGSIPIVTDCPEMRHFSDLPLIFCPKNINDITEEWLSLQSVGGKSTDRMRASYWQQHIGENRTFYHI